MNVAEDRRTEDRAPHRAAPVGTPCPVCGAGAERGQLICLECGSRIALRHRRPPSWKVPVAIVVGVIALAAAGGVLAYEALDADAQRETDAAPPRVADADSDRDADPGASDSDGEARPSGEDDGGGEPSLGEAPSGDRAGSARDEGGADADAPDTTDQSGSSGAAPAGQLVPDGELFTWPRSLRGFTVVVQSSEDNASATSFARSVAEGNDGQVGVIASDDFQTIPEGFFVVFVGRYEGRPAAERAAVRLGRTYPGAFPQAVRR